MKYKVKFTADDKKGHSYLKTKSLADFAHRWGKRQPQLFKLSMSRYFLKYARKLWNFPKQFSIEKE